MKHIYKVWSAVKRICGCLEWSSWQFCGHSDRNRTIAGKFVILPLKVGNGVAGFNGFNYMVIWCLLHVKRVKVKRNVHVRRQPVHKQAKKKLFWAHIITFVSFVFSQEMSFPSSFCIYHVWLFHFYFDNNLYFPLACGLLHQLRWWNNLKIDGSTDD